MRKHTTTALLISVATLSANAYANITQNRYLSMVDAAGNFSAISVDMFSNKSIDITETLEPEYVPGVYVNSWKDNWFVNAQVGANAFIGSPLGCHDFPEKIKPTAQFALGKWHTPYLANRIMFQGFEWISGAIETQKVHHYHVDFMADVAPMFKFFGENSRWSILPYAGLGVIENRTKGRSHFAVNYGVQGRYRILDNLHATAEFGNATTFADADGYGSTRKLGDNLMSLTAGVSWSFGRKTDFEKVVDAAPYLAQNEMLLAYLYDSIDREAECENNALIIQQLRKILAIEGLLDKYRGVFDGENVASNHPVNNYSGLNSLRARMRQAQEKNNTPSDTIASPDIEEILQYYDENSDCLGAPIYFFFRLGTSILVDESQTVNIEEIARVAKTYGLLVEIEGAADSATGTASINTGLASDRAKYIADRLVEYGLEPSRCISMGVGGIADFEPQQANRNAVVRLYLPK